MPRSRLIGREAEIRDARAFLLDEAVPLLTLIGPGGVGKTRLALAIAQNVADGFTDGVVWVDLAPIRDPTLVGATVALAIELTPAPDRDLVEQVVQHLHPQQILLLIDNCEHLLTGTAALIGALLERCPALQVLATSRAPLHIHGEQVYPVPPLAVPGVGATELVVVSEAPAATLFVQQARAANPQFALSEHNAGAIAEICQRVDGLPLAIELAAARSAVLSPAALLALLSQRMRVLSGGARDAPARHQTIREAIAWSYELLDADAQRLFRRLAVFAGGFDFQAATAIGGDEPLSTLDRLGVLVDHSLIQRHERLDADPDTGGTRFRALETIREYGLEVLAESLEHDTTRDAHAIHFLALAEQAEGQLFGGPEQPRWIALLEANHDNFRAAFDWFAEQGEDERCLRLGAALWVFWEACGHWSEGRDRLRRALSGGAGSPEILQMAATRGLAVMEFLLGHYAEVARLLAETLAIDRRLCDKGGVAHAQYLLGLAAGKQGDLDRAAARLEESLALYRDIQDHGGCLSCHRRPWCARSLTAILLGQVAAVAGQRGEDTRARPLLEEALILLRQLGDQGGVAMMLHHLGEVERRQGNADRAAALFTEALALFRELGLSHEVAATLLLVGDVVRRSDAQGHPALLERAIECFTEALTLFRQRQDRRGMASALLAIAAWARDRGESARAVALAEEALSVFRGLGDEVGIAEALNALGDSVRMVGDLRRALACFDESLRLWHDPDQRGGSLGKQGTNLVVAESLRGLAAIAHTAGKPEQAARLLGTALVLHEASGAGLLPGDRTAHEQEIARVRAWLGESAFAVAQTAGRALTVAQAVAAGVTLASDLVARAAPAAPAGHLEPATAFGLTRREREILMLLCQRWTDPEIAEQLFISPKTASRHVSNIFNKLAVNSRREAAAYAVAHGLV